MKSIDFTYDSNAHFTYNGGALPFSVGDVLTEMSPDQRSNSNSFSTFIAKGIFDDKDSSVTNATRFETELGVKVSVETIANITVRFNQGSLLVSQTQLNIKKSPYLWDDFILKDLNADVYIFCELIQSHLKVRDPIELAHWNFYAAEAAILKDFIQRNESMSSVSLDDLVAIQSDFKQLRSAVYSVAHSLQFPFV